jgi:hypothetical protein
MFNSSYFILSQHFTHYKFACWNCQILISRVAFPFLGNKFCY